MLKRVSITSFILILVMMGGLFLISLLEPITLAEAIISVIVGINFYLVVLRIYTKDYGLSMLSIIFMLAVAIIIDEMVGMIIPVLRIGFYFILAVVEVIVAKKQSEIYQEERFWKIEEEIEEQLGTNSKK